MQTPKAKAQWEIIVPCQTIHFFHFRIFIVRWSGYRTIENQVNTTHNLILRLRNITLCIMDESDKVFFRITPFISLFSHTFYHTKTISKDSKTVQKECVDVWQPKAPNIFIQFLLLCLMYLAPGCAAIFAKDTRWR